MGAYLIHADQPAAADYAVVLAGDTKGGHRILTAAELVRQGLVRKAIVDGPVGGYDVHESDPAVDFAVRKGYPADYFLKLPMDATSTEQEAVIVVAELRQLGARSFLLVTSDYHTRRASRYFRKLADGLDMKVIAAPDEYFHWDAWWRTREGQKIVYLEWSKTVASWLGI
jgi:uncharacterized SAM-binding protein YcdF (DUF218 family)